MEIITPSPVGAAFGNALRHNSPGNLLSTITLPNTPGAIDYTVFADGLTIDMWLGGIGFGIAAIASITFDFAPAGELSFFVAGFGENVELSFLSGGNPFGASVPVPGILTAVRHLRFVFPNTAPGVVTVIPHDGAPVTVPYPDPLDILSVSSANIVSSVQGALFGGVDAAVDELALFNGQFPTPTGAAAIPSGPGSWPGIPTP